MLVTSLEKKFADARYLEDFLKRNKYGTTNSYIQYLKGKNVASFDIDSAFKRYLLNPQFLNICDAIAGGYHSKINSMNLFFLKLKSIYKQENPIETDDGTSWLDAGYSKIIRETYGLTPKQMLSLSDYLIRGLEACKLFGENRILHRGEVSEKGKEFLKRAIE